MCNARTIAERATLESFLNAYVKETGNGERKGNLIEVHLPHMKTVLLIPIRYWSATGRHVFSFPLYYRRESESEKNELDDLTAVTLISQELAKVRGNQAQVDEFLMRVLLSKQNLYRFVEARMSREEDVFQQDCDFLEAEQSLIFGHLLHPTPKSRQGMDEEEMAQYSPELKGQFSLHYFRAHRSLVRESSSFAKSASELIKDELKKDPVVCERFRHSYLQDDNYALLPVHPYQAGKLLQKRAVAEAIRSGKLTYLGSVGSPYAPTSSVRTVYRRDAAFMYKFSLDVKITNSVRKNLFKELERGVEVSRLLSGNIDLSDDSFSIVKDPAYITLGGELSGLGFETVLRENPFCRGEEKRAIVLAAFGQSLPGERENRIGRIIHRIAASEGRPVAEIAKIWFRRYLQRSVRPIVKLYLRHGIALEAHQQNTVVCLDEKGYPKKVFYRDNQGYYFCRSKADDLSRLVPGFNEKSDTVCDDAVADERLRYYLFFNNVFGLINAFGTAGVCDERELLADVREELIRLRSFDRPETRLIDSLLQDERLPCKGNFLTRFHDMDELAGSLETQSVYVLVANPLHEGVKKSGALGNREKVSH